MKKVLLVLLGIALVFTSAACGNTGTSADKAGTVKSETTPVATAESTPTNAGPVKIKVWTHSFKDWMDQEKVIADKFNASQSDIQVEVSGYSSAGAGPDVDKELKTMIASDNAPDIGLLNPDYLSEYASREIMVDLQQFSDWKEAGKDMIPGTLELAAKQSIDGKLWIMPILGGMPGLACIMDVDAVKAAGLDPDNPPKTWDDIMAWGEKLTIRENGKVKQYAYDSPRLDGPLFSSIAAPAFLNANNGVPLVEPDKKLLHFDNPAVIDVMKKFMELVKKGYIQTEPAQNYRFQTKLYAVELYGDGGQFNTCKQAGMNVRYFKFPGTEYYPISVGGYSLLKSDETREKAAWEFLKYRASKEAFIAQETMSKWGSTTSAEVWSDPGMKDAYAANEPLQFFSGLTKEIKPVASINYRNAEYMDIFSKELEKMVFAKETVDEGMAAIQDNLKKTFGW